MLLDEAEFREIKRTARRNRMTVADWVRRALRDAMKEEPVHDVMRKLDAVRAAARHEFPTAEIDEMLAEIERGYASPEAP